MFDSESTPPNPTVPAREAVGRFSSVPRPFLRWAGSKQGLLQYLLPLVPKSYGRYYEPFLGSGALFFAIRPKRATLSDASAELIAAWRGVQQNAASIVEYLRPLRPSRELYYHIREGRSAEPVTRAAELLYLNKTCWNGLFRVNSKGKFNVPYGAPKTDNILDEENIMACSRALSRSSIAIRRCDFDRALVRVRQGDLVYLDPPYVTQHNNNGFRDWNETLFHWTDQERLARTAKRLADRGAHVIVSNADNPEVVSLYPGFRRQRLARSSTLASNVTRRGRTTEVVLTANIAME